MENEVTEIGQQAAHGQMARRTLLGVGIGGAALSLLPFLGGSASAADDTTTTAPKRPTDDDVTLLAAAQQIELTARDLYEAGLASGGFSDEQASVLTHLREAHEAYANSLSGMLGRQAPGTRNDDLFDALSNDFDSDADSVLAAMISLEQTLAVTHADLLGRLVGTSGATLIASVQVAEARHSAALAHLAGVTSLSDQLGDGSASSLLESK